MTGLSPRDATLLAGLDEATSAYVDLSFQEWERRLPEVLTRTTENCQSRAWAHRRTVAAAGDEELSRLRRDHEIAAGELESLRERAHALEAELADARADLEEKLATTRTQLAAATGQCEDLQRRLRTQDERVAELEHDLRVVAESLSWRVTAPGRSLRGLLRR